MAFRYIKYLTRDLNNNPPISPEDLSSICKVAKELRLEWGGQFVNFIYEMGFIHPVNGCHALIGYDENFTVQTKTYTLSGFCKLMVGASEFIVLVDQDVHFNDIFQYVKVGKCIDYTRMINDLDGERAVFVSCSANLLATDPRRFAIDQKAVNIIKELDDYKNEYYEVDVLGNQMFEHLSHHICELWKRVIQVKVEEGTIHNTYKDGTIEYSCLNA